MQNCRFGPTNIRLNKQTLARRFILSPVLYQFVVGQFRRVDIDKGFTDAIVVKVFRNFVDALRCAFVDLFQPTLHGFHKARNRRTVDRGFYTEQDIIVFVLERLNQQTAMRFVDIFIVRGNHVGNQRALCNVVPHGGLECAAALTRLIQTHTGSIIPTAPGTHTDYIVRVRRNHADIIVFKCGALWVVCKLVAQLFILEQFADFHSAFTSQVYRDAGNVILYLVARRRNGAINEFRHHNLWTFSRFDWNVNAVSFGAFGQRFTDGFHTDSVLVPIFDVTTGDAQGHRRYC
ncbi:hypothetical protein D3C80_812240 [compost metagenome]